MAALVDCLGKLESSGGNDPEFDSLMKMLDGPQSILPDVRSPSSSKGSKGCLGLIAVFSLTALILVLTHFTFV